MTGNWTEPNESGHVIRDPRVCQACRGGECVSCTGRPYGDRYERSAEAEVRLGPGCLCAEQGHPTPVTCGHDTEYGTWDAFRCDRRVKGSRMLPRKWAKPDEPREYEAHLCGLHLSMYRRREEKAAAQAALIREAAETLTRTEAERAAADEVASLLNEACELIGIGIKAVAKGGPSAARMGSTPTVFIKVDHEAAGALARFIIDRHG